MQTTSVLERPTEVRPVTDTVAEQTQNFSSLVAQHTVDLPGTEWLTRIPLTSPRENVRCLSLTHRFMKRGFDIACATSLVILTSPLLLMAAMLVKLTSPGPVIYSQTRVGLNLRTKKKNDRREQEQRGAICVMRCDNGRKRSM